MGAIFYDLSPEELCELMCGDIEEDEEEEEDGECKEYQD